MCLYVCVCGACAVRVAGDELLALLAFAVHRVAQRARQRHQEANERNAVDEDAAWEVEAFAGRNFWEQSIVLGAGLGCFVVRGGRACCVRSYDKADATRRGLFAARKRGAVGTADDQGEA